MHLTLIYALVTTEEDVGCENAIGFIIVLNLATRNLSTDKRKYENRAKYTKKKYWSKETKWQKNNANNTNIELSSLSEWISLSYWSHCST